MPATPTTLAAIDIGTVSTRLIVARTLPNGTFDVLERQATITDLGEGVDGRGRLAPQAIERTVACVAAYVARIRALSPSGAHVVTTTTSAARDAANANELLEPLRALGLDPQVIAGQTEASLALLGVTASFPANQPLLVADIGGGSTELTCGQRDKTGRLAHCDGVSYQVGCRRVTERFFPQGGPVGAPEREAAAQFIAHELAPRFNQHDNASPLPRTLVAVGGTATSLVSVAHGLVPYDSTFVHLRFMPREQVRELTNRLLALPTEQRAALPGLQPKRAKVVAAGALIIDTLLELGGFDGYTASESDSLIGLLTCLNAACSQAPAPLAWQPATAFIA